MPNCNRGGVVSWGINKNIVDELFYSNLAYKKVEYSGQILFSDVNCKNGKCDKNFKNIVLSKGDGDSVKTPLAIVNFHTHPYSCYTREKVKWGWPSGEDIRECIRFAQHGNLVHLVFSKEGTYIIKVLHPNELKPKVINFIENLLKTTHEYRSDTNQQKLKNEFYKNLLLPIGLKQEKNSLLLWLSLMNGLNMDRLNILYSYYNSGNLSSINSNQQLFEVELISKNKNIIFSHYYVQENCSI